MGFACIMEDQHLPSYQIVWYADTLCLPEQDYAPLSRPASAVAADAAGAALVAAVAHMSGSEDEDDEEDGGGNSNLEASAVEGVGFA